MSVNDTMHFCFVCDEKLGDNYTQLSSSITPHSKITYVEKICEFLGEDFVIFVRSTDRMCLNCTSYLIRVDRLETEIKLIINEMFSRLQKKYGITPPYKTVKILEDAKMLNENLMAVKKSNPGPSSLPVREIPTVTFAPMKTSTSILKIQLQQKQKTQQIQNQQQVQKQQYDGAKRMKILDCTTQVQLQKPINLNQKELEKRIGTQIAAGKKLILVPPKKELNYVCLLCSTFYDNQSFYHEHVKEKHKMDPTTLISTNKREEKYSCPDTAKICLQQGTLPKKKLKVDSPMGIDDNQRDNNNDTKQEEEIDNSSKAKIVKESKSINLYDLIEEEEEQQQQQQHDFAERTNIIECSSPVQLQKPIDSNKKKLKKRIGTQIAAGKKLIQKREEKYSCSDNCKISLQQVTLPKKNLKVDSPMDIDDNQRDNNIDTKQAEEIDNSSKAKNVKESKSIILYDLSEEEEQQQQHDFAERMNIKECSSPVQLPKPIDSNKKKLKKRIGTQIAAGKKLIQKREEKYSCSDNCKICLQQVTLPKKNLKVDSPMDIDDNQRDNNIDTKQAEEIDNSSKAKNVKESKSIILYDLSEEEEEQQQHDFAERMSIKECSSPIQLQKPIDANKRKLKKRIGTKIAAGKKLIQKREEKYSCSDNCKICLQQLTLPKKNLKVDSPMDIVDNQRDNNIDTKQEEEIDNSSKAKNVKESKSIHLYDLIDEK